MKICHVITKPELGGAQLSTFNILSRLSRHKYDISFITSKEGILGPEFRNLTGVKNYLPRFLGRSINPIPDILSFISILSIYKRQKFRLVHTHSSKAGIIGRWAARIAGVPVIVHTVHGWSFNDYQCTIKKRLFVFLERMTAKFTTRIICVSNRDIQIGLKYKIAPQWKFVFIKYGIPISEFRNPFPSPFPLRVGVRGERKKKELGITNNDPVVGMISCLKPQKSPEDYIKAAIRIYKEVPRVNFLLVGDGILRARCQRLLASSPLNGRFILTGWRRDISEILEILDVAVLTSKWEGMPISVIESLCKGCPVVATDVGGTKEIVKNGVTGYLVKPGSFEEIAEKILDILKDTRMLSRMKKEAYLSIDESFALDRMVREIEELYQGLT